jgi:hypothetical protein
MITSPMKLYWKKINDDEREEMTSVALYPEDWWLSIGGSVGGLQY